MIATFHIVHITYTYSYYCTVGAHPREKMNHSPVGAVIDEQTHVNLSLHTQQQQTQTDLDPNEAPEETATSILTTKSWDRQHRKD